MLKLKQTETIKRSNKIVKIAEEIDSLLDGFNFPTDLSLIEKFVGSILLNKQFVDFKRNTGFYKGIYDQSRTIDLKDRKKFPIDKISESIIKIFLRHDIEVKKKKVKKFLEILRMQKSAKVVDVVQ